MKKYFLLATAAVLMTLFACKKEKNETDSSTPGSTKLLKRIIETEAGKTVTHNLSYDGSKRLTSITSSDNSEKISLTYGNDGNVTKIENIEGNVRNVYEFTYTNGKPVSGTFTSFEKDGVDIETLIERYTMTYTVENSLVTKIKMITDEESPEDNYEVNYDLTYSNGNLTKIETSGFASYSATFTYGNKKPIFPSVFKYALDPAGYSLQFFAKHEILTMSFDFPGTELDNSVTSDYTYDANGYVLTANDGETLSRFEYE